MITHIVFFNMRPEANGATAAENGSKLMELLRGLPGKIPEIVDLEVGKDFSGTPASFDVGLLTRFKSKEDLEAYRIHPEHLKVIAFVKATTSDRAVVDYETP